jgi:hypothetical protein
MESRESPPDTGEGQHVERGIGGDPTLGREVCQPEGALVMNPALS